MLGAANTLLTQRNLIDRDYPACTAPGAIGTAAAPAGLAGPSGAISRYTQYAYDNLARAVIVTTVGASGYSATTINTYNGWTTTVTPPVGAATITVADGRGRRVATTETATGQVTTYAYNLADELTGVTNNANTTTQTFDLFGRRTALTDPDNGTLGFGYDSAGNQTTATTHGATITTAYDQLNRPCWTATGTATPSCATPPAVKLTAYSYDSAPNGVGRPATATSTMFGANHTHQHHRL